MPELLITCPNPACAQPLKLPSEAVGQPLSCPYCQSQLKVTLTVSGEVASVVMARKGGMRVPSKILVPGLALMIIGMVAIVANSYIAAQCKVSEGFDLQYARNRAHDLRNGQELTLNASEDKPDDDEKTKEAKKKKRESKEASSDELFGALAGSAAAHSVNANADERTAQLWAPLIYPSRFVGIALGAITLVGGYCMLRGRGYAVAIIGCVTALLNVNELGCCFFGGLAGGWGILMLVRDDGRRYFRIAPNLGSPLPLR